GGGMLRLCLGAESSRAPQIETRRQGDKETEIKSTWSPCLLVSLSPGLFQGAELAMIDARPVVGQPSAVEASGGGPAPSGAEAAGSSRWPVNATRVPRPSAPAC